MSRLEVALQHRFAGGRALDLSFSAPLPGVVALFGPSGSGKTSLVHAIAGLFRPDRARVRIGDVRLADAGLWLRPEQRRVGLVFQDSLLFPHLDVGANLRFGARRARDAGAMTSAPGFDEIVGLLGLEGLLGRRPRTLSGGERQRVAIGRAILSRPLLLAMDEPLAGLDDARRREILPYLARLRRRLDLPILYVTHALDEVMRLADTLVLIRGGRVEAAGEVHAVLADVAGPLAGRDDAAALLHGTVLPARPTPASLVELDAGGLRLRLPLPDASPGVALRLKIPAHEVMLADDAPLPAMSVQNVLPARVLALSDAADGLVTVSLEPRGGGPAILLSRVTAESARRLALVPGASVLALVKSASIVVLS